MKQIGSDRPAISRNRNISPRIAVNQVDLDQTNVSRIGSMINDTNEVFETEHDLVSYHDNGSALYRE